MATFSALLLLATAPACTTTRRAHSEPATSIVLASTTSTQNSGLLDALLPEFTRQTGIDVRVVAVGTGQAFRLARRGDADVLLVHDQPAERQFVALGEGLVRRPVMHNDFVLIGPAADPAGLRNTQDVVAAFKRLAAQQALFVSRGDDSGTHRREKSLWRAAKVQPESASGSWYRATGAGMGTCLNIAAGLDAYILSDRATWAAFANRGRLEILVQGGPRLQNPYGVILINPARHPAVHSTAGRVFVDWLVSRQGQSAIAAFRIGGKQVFFPDAMPETSPGNHPGTASPQGEYGSGS